MALFHLKLIINATTFILEQVIFHFLMEMFLAPLPMAYTFHNLFVCERMTLTTETIFCLLSYLNKVIDTINAVKKFLNFITDTQS